MIQMKTKKKSLMITLLSQFEFSRQNYLIDSNTVDCLFNARALNISSETQCLKITEKKSHSTLRAKRALRLHFEWTKVN